MLFESSYGHAAIFLDYIVATLFQALSASNEDDFFHFVFLVVFLLVNNLPANNSNKFYSIMDTLY